MASFSELMQKCVNEDYETLVGMARSAMKDVLPACKKVDTDNDGFLMLSSLILSALGADGKLSALERKFTCEVMGIDDDTLDKFIKMYSSKMFDLADKFVDNMGTDVKAAAALLVISICACDETINRDEVAFIRRLLE